MKNRVPTISILLCLLLCPALSWSQTPGATTTPGKIGLINIQGAIANTAEGKKALGDLQKKYQSRQQQLQQMQQEIASLQDQLQRQVNTLSDDERLRLSRELEDKQKVFKRSQEDFQTDSQGDSQDVMRRIGQKMLPLIQDYARHNGFVLILEDAQLQPYYSVPEIELTEEIIKRYDAANPSESAGAPSGGTPPAPPANKTPAAPKPVVKPPASKPKP